MQNLYAKFFHENFYTTLNYSNRAVIHVTDTNIFLHENFYHKKICTKIKRIKVNYLFRWILLYVAITLLSFMVITFSCLLLARDNHCCTITVDTVQHRLSKLIGGKGVHIIKYVKLNIHTFLYRALLNYSNEAYTC